MWGNGFSKFSAISCMLLLCVCFLFSVLPAQSYRGIGGGTSFYGGESLGDDWGYSIVLTRDVGLAMAGSTQSYGAGGSDMWLIRTVLKPYTFDSGSGAFQAYAWNKTYGGTGEEAAKQVIESRSGGFALAGYTNSSGAGGLDMFLVKTDINGEIVCGSTFGGPYDDSAKSIVEASDGGYVLAGYTHTSQDQQVTWVVKTDSAGVMQWNRTYLGLSANCAIVGYDDTITLAVDFPGAFGLMKLSPSGELLWNQVFSAVWSVAYSQSLVELREGGYVLAGWMENSETNAVAGWVVKVDPLGNQLWNTIVDGVRLYSAVEMSNGDIAMCGDYASVVIVNSLGNIEFNRPNDSLSDDLRPRVFTAAYSIIEASALHLVMAGAQESYGQIPRGYNALLMTYNLVTDSTPPTINLLFPINGETYSPDDVPLAFYADSSTVRLWYGIDDQGNYTITGNMTLPTLTEGTHKITIYGQDEAYNTAASEPATFLTRTIIFNVAANIQPLTTQPTQASTGSATPETGRDPNVIVYLATAVGIIVATLAILGWRLRKDIPSSTDLAAKPQ